MASKKLTKRQQALDALERAQNELGKALSLLGGRVRHRPRALPYPWSFIARQHIEIAKYRAQVAQMAVGGAWDEGTKNNDVGVHSADSSGSVPESVRVPMVDVTFASDGSDRD